ncbi:unnamed protein product [Blepharisma stoltei]|uniref:Macro domain-containing protein n=1 Tax=Blepharisma stoltei TaxID=1481888 RepID=A0AAU9JA77_9CILI|nr:unnamed protein product [Blepharisma stoltei]
MGACCSSNPLGIATIPKELLSNLINKTKLTIMHGDITLEVVDVIVNSTNVNLIHKGGVAEAISTHGGATIQEESNKYIKNNGPLTVSSVIVAPPGKLQCKRLFHAVGPIYIDGNKHEADLLSKTIENALEEAQKLSMKSISFPAISSGIFSFPKVECAGIFFSTIHSFLEKNPNTCIEEIRLINNDFPTAKVFEQEYKKRK